MSSPASSLQETAGSTVDSRLPRLLLTATEAAQVLGIGRSKLYELLRAGLIPSVHIGACRRIPADALPAFIAELAGTTDTDNDDGPRTVGGGEYKGRQEVGDGTARLR